MRLDEDVIRGNSDVVSYATYGVAPENVNAFREIHESRESSFKWLKELEPKLQPGFEKFKKQILQAINLLKIEQREIKQCSLVSGSTLRKWISSIKIQHHEAVKERNLAIKYLQEFEYDLHRYKSCVSVIKGKCNDLRFIAPTVYMQYLQKDSALDEAVARYDRDRNTALQLKVECDQIYGEYESEMDKLTRSESYSESKTSDIKGYGLSGDGLPGETYFQSGDKHHQSRAYSRAWSDFEKSAAQDYPPAYLYLAWMYQEGKGVVKDSKVVVKRSKVVREPSWSEKVRANWSWFESRTKSVEVQYYIGICYERGIGVVKDEKEALKWYRLAAESGNARMQNVMGALYQHGKCVIKDDKEAMKWYRLAATQGYPYAQYNLGCYYFYGTVGVGEIYEKEAAVYFRMSAESGLADGQVGLGCVYEQGRGVTKDIAEALKWYYKAADQENAEAQCNLGRLHLNHGKNAQEALKWYRLAAAQGHQEAQKQQRLLETPRPVVSSLASNRSAFQNEQWRRRNARNNTAVCNCILQ